MQFLYNIIRLITINLIRQRDIKIYNRLFGQLIIMYIFIVQRFREILMANEIHWSHFDLYYL